MACTFWFCTVCIVSFPFLSIMAGESTKSRQNYSGECEALINKQINVELCAHHQFLALVAFYGRDTIALEGFAKLFRKSAEKSSEKANKLIDYQNLRGGKVTLCQVSTPTMQEWQKPLDALEFVLKMEKEINEEYLKMRKTAQEKNDFHLMHYLDTNMIHEQYEFLSELTRMITNLNRIGDGLGVYIFDKYLRKSIPS